MEAAKTTAIARYNENKFIQVATDFTQGQNGIIVAPNYDVKGAVKTLYLQCIELKDKAGRPALEVCTPQSIEKSIREMLAKGLNPNKKQCYPIVYGNQLQIQASYQGNKRAVYSSSADVIKNSIRSQVIYQGDKFIDKICTDGRRELVEHTQPPFEKRTNIIIGAYATVTFKNKKTMIDVMTIDEIKASWAMSRTGGDVHKKFSHEMACKTVESRLSKKLYASTDESNLEANEHFEQMENDDNVIIYDIPAENTEPEYAGEQSETVVGNAEESLPPVDSFDDETQPETESVLTIRYGDWNEKYKSTGEWVQVKGTYDQTAKTVQIRKI